MLTQEFLKEHFNYIDGVLFYKKRPSKTGVNPVGKPLGHINKNGYLKCTIKSKTFLVHRLIWIYFNGSINGDIDHINHIKTDNRIENLRVVDSLANNRNQSIPSNNTSGQVGVWFENNKWRASIYVDYKRINLGSFAVFSDAVNARKNAEVLYGFHENHGKEM